MGRFGCPSHVVINSKCVQLNQIVAWSKLYSCTGSAFAHDLVTHILVQINGVCRMDNVSSNVSSHEHSRGTNAFAGS